MTRAHIISNISSFYVSILLCVMIIYRNYELFISDRFDKLDTLSLILIILVTLLFILYSLYQILRSISSKNFRTKWKNRLSRITSFGLLILASAVTIVDFFELSFYNIVSNILFILSILIFESYWLTRT